MFRKLASIGNLSDLEIDSELTQEEFIEESNQISNSVPISEILTKSQYRN